LTDKLSFVPLFYCALAGIFVGFGVIFQTKLKINLASKKLQKILAMSLKYIGYAGLLFCLYYFKEVAILEKIAAFALFFLLTIGVCVFVKKPKKDS
jgi:energy-converting hydrogenase Eha subunit C